MPTPSAQGLDRLSHTFTRDQEFCDALAATHPWDVGRLFVYLRWGQNYINPIQEELDGIVARHFAAAHAKDAGLWTVSLVGGIFRDLALVPYLVVRGLVSKAGFVVRRSLENVGVLAHLWQDPSKAVYLAEPENAAFRNAFTAETDPRKAAELKDKSVQKRFAACLMGKALSDLYRLLSAYTVHGGSPKQLVMSELAPGRLSCMLANRPDPLEKDLGRELKLLTAGCEMLCVEVVHVHGTFAKKYGVLPSKGGEGGFYLTKLLEDGPDAEIAHLVRATLHDLGWVAGEGP